MSPYTKIDTLILSDIHLGSPVGKAVQVTSLLKRHHFRRLILLGDIIDNSDFDHMNKENIEFINTLRRLSDPRSGCKVIWISGNHDREMRKTVKKIIGSQIREYYSWENNNKRFLAVHGDQFDGFIDDNKKTNDWAHFIFLYLQNLDRRGKHIIKYVDKTTALLRRLSKRVATGAVAYAQKHQAHTVFCGHTHVPMEKIYGDGESSVHYVNVGCWTHTPSTFAVIDNLGNILLEKYS